jgi:hypothetical protein
MSNEARERSELAGAASGTEPLAGGSVMLSEWDPE